MSYLSRSLSGIALAALMVGPASGADHTILGKQLLVKDASLGADPTKPKLVGQGVERSSPNSIVGNPTIGGATVTFYADGATSSNQTFVLPAALWSASGTTGFSYKDATGAAGPVRVAQIKRSARGTFTIKATVVAKHGPVTVVPPNPGTGGCILLEINGGDRYHMLLGPGSVFSKNDPYTLQIKNATTEGLCVPLVCVTTSGCFCDTGDGTIHDTCTGLQWEKKTTPVDSGANPADLHDVDNMYAWAGCCGETACCGDCTNYCQPNAAAQAACRAQTPSAQWASGGCNQCAVGTCQVDPVAVTTVWDWVSELSAAHFAGYTDWRLPSEADNAFCTDCEPAVCERELEKLFDQSAPGCTMAEACIDPIFGPTISDRDYWSSTTRGGYPGEAIGVFFLDGADEECGPDYKDAPYHLVRAVRGTALPTTTSTTSTSTSIPSTTSTSTSITTTTSTSVTSTTVTFPPGCVATSGRFCDLGDGTVFDAGTGLQWEQKDTAVGSGVNPADLHDVDNNYTWAGRCTMNNAKLCQPTAAAETLCKAQTPTANWTNGCQQCTGGDGTCNVNPHALSAVTTVWDWLDQLRTASFAGHADWRLPSEAGCNTCHGAESCCAPSELETILLAPYPCGTNPCIPSIFGPANSLEWSASTEYIGLAWFVNMAGANLGWDDKTRPYGIRAVR